MVQQLAASGWSAWRGECDPMLSFAIVTSRGRCFPSYTQVFVAKWSIVQLDWKMEASLNSIVPQFDPNSTHLQRRSLSSKLVVLKNGRGTCYIWRLFPDFASSRTGFAGR